MGQTLVVDTSALHDGARTLRDWVSQLEASPAGGPARSALVELGSELQPAGTATAANDLAEAVQAVTTQVVTALQGLASGLDNAATAYHQVDVVSGAAAEQLADTAPPRLLL